MAAPIDEATEAQLHGVPLMLRASWRFGRKLYLYIKAGAWLALTGLGVVADQYDVVDVQAFVRSAFASSPKLSLIVAAATVTWFAIGYFAHGQKGFSASNKLDDGE